MWNALASIFQNSVNWTLYVGADYAKTLKIDSHNYDVLNAYGEFRINTEIANNMSKLLWS